MHICIIHVMYMYMHMHMHMHMYLSFCVLEEDEGYRVIDGRDKAGHSHRVQGERVTLGAVYITPE